MKRLIVASLALALSACATTSIASPRVLIAQADAKLTMAETAYAAARPFVALFLPWLPEPQRARVEAAQAVVERALAAARAAVTAADRLAAAEAAADAVAQYRFVSGS